MGLLPLLLPLMLLPLSPPLLMLPLLLLMLMLPLLLPLPPLLLPMLMLPQLLLLPPLLSTTRSTMFPRLPQRIWRVWSWVWIWGLWIWWIWLLWLISRYFSYHIFIIWPKDVSKIIIDCTNPHKHKMIIILHVAMGE